MISHADFVAVFAETLGWPETDVRHRLRWLREDNQVERGRAGRGGSGAAQATPEMVARLIMAMGATDDAKRAPAAVRLLWEDRMMIRLANDGISQDDVEVVRKGRAIKGNKPASHQIVKVPHSIIEPRFIGDSLRYTFLEQPNEHLVCTDRYGNPGEEIVYLQGRRLGEVLSHLLILTRSEEGRAILKEKVRNVSFDREAMRAKIEVKSEEYRPYIYAQRLFDSIDSADLHLKAGWHRDSPRPRAPVCFEVTFPVECLLAAGEILGPTQFSISEAEPRPPVIDQMAEWFRSQPNIKERNADKVFRSFTKQFPEASFDEFQAAYEGGADETRKSAKKSIATRRQGRAKRPKFENVK